VHLAEISRFNTTETITPKNRQLEADAFESPAARREARRRDDGCRKRERAGHGGNRKSKVLEKPLMPTLSEAGIDKNLANRARKLHAVRDHKTTAPPPWNGHTALGGRQQNRSNIKGRAAPPLFLRREPNGK
jgi:hypothetical protein